MRFLGVVSSPLLMVGDYVIPHTIDSDCGETVSFSRSMIVIL